MKKLVLFLLLFSLVIFSQKSYAHLPGQPSYFVINNKYSNLYPFPTKLTPGVELPQDIAPEKYTVDQTIHFKIDVTKFPQASIDAIRKTKFYWKFGDGGLGEGLENDHIYKQPGDYVIKIVANDGTTPTPQLFESVLVRILPKTQTHEVLNTQILPIFIGGSFLLIVFAVIFYVRYSKGLQKHIRQRIPPQMSQ